MLTDQKLSSAVPAQGRSPSKGLRNCCKWDFQVQLTPGFHSLFDAAQGAVQWKESLEPEQIEVQYHIIVSFTLCLSRFVWKLQQSITRDERNCSSFQQFSKQQRDPSDKATLQGVKNIRYIHVFLQSSTIFLQKRKHLVLQPCKKNPTPRVNAARHSHCQFLMWQPLVKPEPKL